MVRSAFPVDCMPLMKKGMGGCAFNLTAVSSYALTPLFLRAGAFAQVTSADSKKRSEEQRISKRRADHEPSCETDSGASSPKSEISGSEGSENLGSEGTGSDGSEETRLSEEGV